MMYPRLQKCIHCDKFSIQNEKSTAPILYRQIFSNRQKKTYMDTHMKNNTFIQCYSCAHGLSIISLVVT